jgi:tetratricopeptide (TPR) repeat protein
LGDVVAHITPDKAQELYATAEYQFVQYYLSHAQKHLMDFEAQGEELANFQVALSICEHKHWWKIFGQFLEVIRFAIQNQGHWIEYRQWLELILQQPDIANQLNDQTLYLTLMDDYATLIHTQGEREAAIEIYREIIEKVDQQQNLIKAYAHYGLGQIHFAAGQHIEAANQWQLASSIAEQLGESGFIAITHYLLDSTEDKVAPLMSMEIKDGNSFPKEQIWKKYFEEHFRGRRYFDAQQLTKAQESYTLVCDLAKQLNDQEGLSLALFHLGEIARMIDQPQLALRYYHDSEQIAQKLNHHSGISLIYNGISRVHLGQERYDLARPYLEESVHLERQFGESNALAERLFMLGYAKANTGSLDEAVACFRETKKLFTRLSPGRVAEVEQVLKRLEAVMDRSK